MAGEARESVVPKEVEEAAQMAEELHGKLFPKEGAAQNATPPEDEKPADTPNNEPIPDENLDDEDEKLYATRYKRLQGKYNAEVPRMAKELKELRHTLDELRAAQTAPKQDEKPGRDAEILQRLKDGYPEDFVNDIDELMSLRAEVKARQEVQQAVQPVQQKQLIADEADYQARSQDFVSYVDSKTKSWQPIWSVVEEINNGLEPSDPRIAAFLAKPDPSGLYTNYELLNAYEQNFDKERFATVCSLYDQQRKPQQNPSRDALLAPSRSSSQPTPNATEAKVWTMKEFEQFQRDDRAGKYDDESSAAMWADAQKALAEGRFR